MANEAVQPVEIKVPTGFKIEELGRGRVAVTVPRGDESMVIWLQARRAKWDRERRAWAVPGTKRADLAAKLGRMAESEIASAAATNIAKEAAAVAFSEHAATLKEIRGVRILGSTVTMLFEYSDKAMAVARGLPGAKWNGDSKVWTFAPASAADVHAVVSGCRRIADMVEAMKAESAACRSASLADRMTARVELESRRILVTVGTIRVGQTMVASGRLVTVTDLGKAWHLRSEDACVYGRLPEDAYVQYAYHRPATEAESAAYEARQAAERARVEKLEARNEAIAAAHRAMDASGQYLESSRIDHAAIDAGEVILEEDVHLRPYGGGTKWVVAGDILWRLQGNSADGDDWSRSNCRTGIAICLQADRDAMITSLREAGRA